jgi:hypothetical protein
VPNKLKSAVLITAIISALIYVESMTYLVKLLIKKTYDS